VWNPTADRVLLHRSGDDLFCEPFPGSTWILPAEKDFPIRGIERLTDRNHHDSLGSVLRRGEDPGTAPWLYVHLRHDYISGGYHDQLFFFDDVQAQLRRVPWLVFLSDNYIVPGLFLIPRHELELARMFPRRDVVFHHLGRYLFNPSNTVWDMVTRYHDSYFTKADEREVRMFPWWAPISTDELYGRSSTAPNARTSCPASACPRTTKPPAPPGAPAASRQNRRPYSSCPCTASTLRSSGTCTTSTEHRAGRW